MAPKGRPPAPGADTRTYRAAYGQPKIQTISFFPCSMNTELKSRILQNRFPPQFQIIPSKIQTKYPLRCNTLFTGQSFVKVLPGDFWPDFSYPEVKNIPEFSRFSLCNCFIFLQAENSPFCPRNWSLTLSDTG